MPDRGFLFSCRRHTRPKRKRGKCRPAHEQDQELKQDQDAPKSILLLILLVLPAAQLPAELANWFSPEYNFPYEHGNHPRAAQAPTV
jgi:hypothetical protein